MNDYISIKAVLNRIPSSIKEEVSEGWILSRALDAYRDLDISGRLIDDVVIVKLKNHLATLPEDAKKLNLVTYMCYEPSDCEVDNLLCNLQNDDPAACDPCQPCTTCDKIPLEYDTRTDVICDFPLSYQVFIQSNFYHNNFLPLRFVGETAGNLCKNCINRMCHECLETFSITPERNILSSLEDGYLCIDYKKEPKSEDGDFLILNDPRLIQGLSLYVEAEAWRNRRGLKEQSANNYYNDTLQKAEIMLKSFKGRQRLRSIDGSGISETVFVNSRNQRLMRLPGNLLNGKNRYGR